VTLAELLDLAIKPSETLLQIGTLSLKRVDHLLHPRQAILPGRDQLEVMPLPTLPADRPRHTSNAWWPPWLTSGRRRRSALRRPRSVYDQWSTPG
jgi:hypothetical protein